MHGAQPGPAEALVRIHAPAADEVLAADWRSAADPR